MSARFQEVFRLPPFLFLENCPILIEAAVLQKDTVTNKVLAQIKLRNLDERHIKATKISICAYEINGVQVEGLSNYSYLDLNVKKGDDFGSRTPIYLPDSNTRKISVSVSEIVFSNGDVWVGESSEWEPIPFQELIFEHFSNSALQEQYELEVGENCRFVPIITKGLFLCTCGTVNLAQYDECRSCHRHYHELAAILDEEYLSQRSEERIKREKEEREEQERKAEEARELKRAAEAEKKRKRKRTASILIPIIVIIGILAALTPKYILPAVKNTLTYFEARKLLEEESFDDAEKLFISLGSFLNASKMSKESNYRKAIKQISTEDYQSAINILTKLGDYSDSKSQLDVAKESYYQLCITASHNKDYEKAIKGFDFLSSYKDAYYLYISSCYEYAIQLANSDKYGQAIRLFEATAGYKDSNDLLIDATYNYGCQLLSLKEFDNAISQFNKCSTYKDADQLILEATYSKGCQLYGKKEYDRAVEQFSKCSDYKDSSSKITEAKYQYVKNHMNSSDSLTYKYLQDLVGLKYEDSKSIYKELYAWTVSIVMNDSETNNTTRKTSISKYGNFYCHVTLSGGAPSAKTKLKYTMRFPDGDYFYGSWDGEWRSGDTGTCWGYYTRPAYGAAGTFKIFIYDKNTGEKLGEDSIYIS